MVAHGGRVRFVFDPAFERYDFGPQHPLRPERSRLVADLIERLGWWRPGGPEHLEPLPADDDELHYVHTPRYVEVVRRLSAPHDSPDWFGYEHGFGVGDNPPFPGMHDATALVAGGTLRAVRGILRGDFDHAFNPAGGLHHALPEKASGFCIYDDPALACAAALREFDARVFYVDFDAHHGDGPQWIFYDEPRVFTLSFHETGRFLFPGTGDVDELGRGRGQGYSANVPFQPFTQDASWLDAVNAVLPELVERFKPDLIVSVHGTDTHRWDPLTHMALSVNAMREQTRLTHELAHAYCGGRWLALGAGGYDPYRVSSRAWSALWAEMAGLPIPERLPASWLERWQPRCNHPLPPTFADPDFEHPPMPRRAEIEAQNRSTVTRLRERLNHFHV